MLLYTKGEGESADEETQEAYMGVRNTFYGRFHLRMDDHNQDPRQ